MHDTLPEAGFVFLMLDFSFKSLKQMYKTRSLCFQRILLLKISVVFELNITVALPMMSVILSFPVFSLILLTAFTLTLYIRYS